jgi:hypothetical protein
MKNKLIAAALGPAQTVTATRLSRGQLSGDADKGAPDVNAKSGRAKMLRRVAAPFVAAIAISVVVACPASADDRWVDKSTPGLQFDVTTNQPCTNWVRYTYGVNPAGKPMACVSFDGGRTGKWSDSASVVGVRQVGAPCQEANAALGGVIAQTADGRPMICDGARGFVIRPNGNLG